MKSIPTIAATALALSFALQAQASTLPQPTTENGVTFLSGGIGHDEAAALKAEAKNYPLSLVFSAGKDNAFLADIKVTIRDHTGKEVLSTTSAGPIMLIKLPAGRYKIDAQRGDGKHLHRTVQVAGHGDRRVAFHWQAA